MSSKMDAWAELNYDETPAEAEALDAECSLNCARWVPYDKNHKRYDPSIRCTCKKNEGDHTQ